VLGFPKIALCSFVASWILAAPFNSKAQESKAELEKALSINHLEAVRAAVTNGRKSLGRNEGEPEVADVFQRAPADTKILTKEEAQRGFTPYFSTLERMRWWKIGVDPTTLTAPLRAPASIIAGNVAAVRAKLDGADRSLAIAKEAADFLIWAQEQAGSGVYPFPAARGTSNARAMEVGTRFMESAEKTGKIGSIVRNGWVFDDFGEGGLQFDNGECGSAMLDLYEVTKDQRYLDSARKAADWAYGRPLCSNWNYNSFSVFLLAKMFAVTHESKYLNAAIQKTLLGIIPGQLTDGPHAGRWMDPHNARPAYHYIMMRALAELLAVMPPNQTERPEILNALTIGLKTRNTEMATQGVMNKDHALEALLLVNQVFKNQSAFLRETQSIAALNALSKLISQEAHQGKHPLSPGAWGLFLEYIAGGS